MAVAPTQGQDGCRAAGLPPKTVVLYKGPNSQPQPRTWEPSRSDYSRVGSFRTGGYGRFRTSAVRVNGTTAFIVRYPGDATYWRAYTTPVLVKVKEAPTLVRTRASTSTSSRRAYPCHRYYKPSLFAGTPLLMDNS